MRRRLASSLVAIAAVALVGCPMSGPKPLPPKTGPCPEGMAHVKPGGQKAYCIDRWEASLVELDGTREVPHTPFETVSSDARVKAVTRAGVIPQGYISKNQAESACKAAAKRLCTGDEWLRVCRGEKATTYPYGEERQDGACNNVGRAPFATLFPELGGNVYGSAKALNDPRINQSSGTVAKTGVHAKCKNDYGVYDMVGNLHEWVAEVSNGRGTFRGGYYQDTHLNGDGCKYKTVVHDVAYHDYSTGFRCCADAADAR